MTKEVRDFVIEKTKDLMAAHSCSAEAKAAAPVQTKSRKRQPDTLRSWKLTLCR